MKAWKLSPIAVAIFSLNSYAVEPVGLGLGNGFTLMPSLDLNVENNDNIYSQSEDETADTISRIKPAVALNGDFGKFTFNSYLQLEQGLYGEDENDDYLDQLLNAGGQYELNARHQFAVNAGFVSGHDPRGSGTAEGSAALAIDDPDQYDEVTGALNYTFGTDTSAANVDLFTDSYQKRYTNNEEFGTENRDHDKLTYGARLTLNASDRTKVLFEAKQTGISYSEDSATAEAREGDLQVLLTGLRWDISGKTTGEVKVGRAARTFDEDGIDSNTRLNWEANVVWNPLTYSTVTLTSSQLNNETNGAGTYIAGTYTSASWEHEFTALFSAGINASVNSDVYVDDLSVDTNGDGNGDEGRKDDTVAFGLNATYAAMPWMDITADFKQSSKDSNDDDLDNDSQIISLGLKLAL